MGPGGMILCGGRSSRMGRDKASLPFGSELMLQRVLRLVTEGLSGGPIVVVAAQGQELPALPASVRIARDQNPEHGPLEGLAAGMEVLDQVADTAFVTSCDVPLLSPDVIRLLLSTPGEWDAVVPQEERFLHPLCAVYRTSTLTTIRQLLARDEYRPRAMFQQVRTVCMPVETLRTVDPELLSLINLNHPEDYQRALALAGLPAPD